MQKISYLIASATMMLAISCGGNKEESASTATPTDTSVVEETAVPEEVLDFNVEGLLKDLGSEEVKEKFDGKWITLEGEVYQVSDNANYNDSATIAFSFVVDKDLLNNAKVTPNKAPDAFLYSFGCDTYLSPTYVANNKEFKLKEGDKIKIRGRFENHFSSGPQFDKAVVVEHKPK